MWFEFQGNGRSFVHLEPEDVEAYVKRGLEQDGVISSSAQEIGNLDITTYPDGTLSGAMVEAKL